MYCTPVPVEVKNCPAVPALPPAVKVPVITPLSSVLFVSVSLPALVAKVPVVGSVTPVVAVAVKVVVKAPTVARAEPSAKVKVALVAGAVRVNLLIEVAEATPKVGVVKVGEIVKASTPEPDSSVIMLAKSAEEPTVS
jgi:hypothetical protein